MENIDANNETAELLKIIIQQNQLIIQQEKFLAGFVYRSIQCAQDGTRFFDYELREKYLALQAKAEELLKNVNDTILSEGESRKHTLGK